MNKKQQARLSEIDEAKKIKNKEVDDVQKKIVELQNDSCKFDDEVISLQRRINEISDFKNKNQAEIGKLKFNLSEAQNEVIHLSNEESEIKMQPEEEMQPEEAVDD